MVAAKRRMQYGGFHGLRQNDDLSDAEYVAIKAQIEKVNSVSRDWLGYIERRGLDPSIFHPQNEWADIINVATSRSALHPTDYFNLNYVRLMSPFTGFHLPFLDRIDGFRRFDNKLSRDIQNACAQGIPADIAERMDALNPFERLEHTINDYLSLIARLPDKYIVDVPQRSGEVGLLINERLVNPEVLICQGRINALHDLGVLPLIERKIAENGCARILEIGPGYGALATALRSLYPQKLEYIAVELPYILWNCVAYMTTNNYGSASHVMQSGEPFPSSFGVLFLANYLLDEFKNNIGPVDIAINTMSFIEMSKPQVTYYRDTIRENLSSDGVCVIEGVPSRPHHVDCDSIFSETMTKVRTSNNPALNLVPLGLWC